MKRKVLTGLSGLLVVILFSALLLTGCGGGGSFTSLAGLAKMAPQDSGTILFIDVKKIKADKDLGKLYDEMKDGFEDEITAGGSDMDFDDIHYMGMTQVNYREVIWVNGDLDLDELRNELEEDDYDKDDYRGVEIWYGYGDAVAIHNGTLIIGDEDSVEESIKAVVDPERSLYEKNEDVRDVIKELTGGLFSMLSAEGYYPGARAVGMTFSKLNTDTMELSGCFKFDDEDDAEDALSDIERDLESGDMYRAADVSQSGNFVEFSAEIDIEEADLFW